jgi:hypothetical protein
LIGKSHLALLAIERQSATEVLEYRAGKTDKAIEASEKIKDALLRMPTATP